MHSEAPSGIKFGLALSGGGFRSALFHIGVLARLAEMDLLRRIDVISSVSGGSIIAAFYYLNVKALLETKPSTISAPPGQQAFIRMVTAIERDFLAAVQKNMLTRTFLDPVKNARMLTADYSNTERMAELLTTHFYRPVWRKNENQGDRDDIQLKNIAIHPFPGSLAPGTRIPRLFINATCLNTGHLWRFAENTVGETPISHESGLSHIDYLKKFHFNDERLTIEERKILYNITLGQAVAASCCVPGFFEPLQIRHLYKAQGRPMTIRLVDGGLVDNQGLASLFSENCTHVLCSDASDILKPEHDPSGQFFNVAIRANDILMDRIRGKNLSQLFGLGPGRFAFLDMGDPNTRSRIFPADSEKLVAALTRIRTDLDSFTDREAFALMTYGYELCRLSLADEAFRPVLGPPSEKTENWGFKKLRDGLLASEEGRRDLLLHLEVGSRQMFKVFLLKKPLPFLILLPAPLIFALACLFVIRSISPAAFWGITLFGVLMLLYTQNRKLLKIMDNVSLLRNARRRILKTLVSLRLPEPFSYIMSAAAWIHLAVFDRLFLKYGGLPKTRGNKLAKKGPT